MNVEYLNLLKDIRDTLEDIEFLHGDLHDLLDNPEAALENLVPFYIKRGMGGFT